MEIKLKHKYTVYNGDVQLVGGGLKSAPQYSFGRNGNGNGKRPKSFKVPDAFRAASADASKHNKQVVKVMRVNALTGHKVMENPE